VKAAFRGTFGNGCQSASEEATVREKERAGGTLGTSSKRWSLVDREKGQARSETGKAEAERKDQGAWRL